MTVVEKIKYLCLLLLILMAAACEKDAGEMTEALTDPLIPDETTTVDTDTGNTESLDTSQSSFTEQFMELVNHHRISLGLLPLENDESMSRIALTHSESMAQKLIPFGHTGFSERCEEARSALGGGNLCGENVAWGQKDPQAVFKSWMSSSGHRANIEGARFTHSGLGFSKSASGTIYWTHLFMEER